MRYALQRAGGGGGGVADIANQTVPGDLDISGVFTVGGNASFAGDLTASGAVTAGGTLSGSALDLGAAVSPFAAAADARRLIAGTLPIAEIVDQWGQRLQLETSAVRHRKYVWLAQAGVASGWHYVSGNSVATGTGGNEPAYTPVHGTTRFAAMARNAVYGASGAGSPQYNYVTVPSFATARSDGAAGGFRLDLVVAGRDAAFVANKRAFFGAVRASAPCLSNTAYESFANLIGFVKKAASAQLFFICRGASAGVEVDLGASWPFDGTAAAPNAYAATIWQNPGERGYVHYLLRNVNTLAEIGGRVAVDDTQQPDPTYGLTWINCANNNTTALSVYVTTAAVGIDPAFC